MSDFMKEETKPKDIQQAPKIAQVEKKEEENLLIPHSRLVELAKSKKTARKFVRRRVYQELNRRIKAIVEDIMSEMFNTPNAYIELPDLDRAMRKYTEALEIINEKSRIIAHLNAMKADVEKLARELSPDTKISA
jgi:hypothetical protein